MVLPKKHTVGIRTYPFLDELERARLKPSLSRARMNLGRRVLSGALALVVIGSCIPVASELASADTLVIESIQDLPLPDVPTEEPVETAEVEPEELVLSVAEASGLSDDQVITDNSNPLSFQFQDVACGMYFTDAVDYMTSLGFMDGTSSATFSPNMPATRAVVVEVLYRIAGKPSAPAPNFTDVSPSSPYAAAIGWAAANEIVKGYGESGKFGPNDGITRQQLAAVFFRYVNLKNLDDGSRADLSKFPDNQTVDPWARESFAWANAKGVINGVSNTWLQPNGGAIRAQLAVMAQRYCTNILKISLPTPSTSQESRNSSEPVSVLIAEQEENTTGSTLQSFEEDQSTTDGTAFRVPATPLLAPSNMAQASRGNNCAIDTSMAAQGYVTVTATASSRLKLQVSCGQMSYNYDMPNDGSAIVVPFNMGDGSYKVRVMQNTSGSKYAELFATKVNVALASPTAPFVRPNAFCWYTNNSQCVAKAKEIAAGAKNQGAALRAVYRWITNNITYDRTKANQLAQSTGYIPDPDETLRTGKGICFDYASLAAAMLRSLGIPCKVMTGYVSPGNLYHAWNMVYIDGKWVSVRISVDPLTWTRIDATFAASGGGADNYVGDGTSYTDRYTY